MDNRKPSIGLCLAPSLVLISGYASGLARAETDPGRITWEHVLLGPGGGWALLQIDPRNDDVVYAGSDMGNWAMSEDGGKTWIEMTPQQLAATAAGGPQITPRPIRRASGDDLPFHVERNGHP